MSEAFLIIIPICFGALTTAFFFEGRIQRLRDEFEDAKRRLRDEIEEERRIRGRVDELKEISKFLYKQDDGRAADDKLD